jgi:lipopolysaccharide assembly protein A
MTQHMAPHRTTSTRPSPSANGSTTRSAPAPQAAEHAPLQTRLSATRATLTVGSAALIVTVIFTIQNVHAANISFLGIHLVLPLAGALLLAAIAGSLLTVAAGPARITRLRQITRRGLRKARANSWAPYDRSPQEPERTPRTALEAPVAFFPGDQPDNTTVYASHETD